MTPVKISDINDMNDKVSKEVDEKLKENINELGIKEGIAVVTEGSKYTVLDEENQKLLNVVRSLGWETVPVRVFERPQGSDTPTVGKTATPVVSPNP